MKRLTIFISNWTKWYSKNLQRGLCGHCGRNVLETKSLCKECLEEKRLKRKL